MNGRSSSSSNRFINHPIFMFSNEMCWKGVGWGGLRGRSFDETITSNRWPGDGRATTSVRTLAPRMPFDVDNSKVKCKQFSKVEVVVAQVVECWHSAWAVRVRIPGRTLAFFRSELLSIYSHWVAGFF